MLEVNGPSEEEIKKAEVDWGQSNGQPSGIQLGKGDMNRLRKEYEDGKMHKDWEDGDDTGEYTISDKGLSMVDSKEELSGNSVRFDNFKDELNKYDHSTESLEKLKISLGELSDEEKYEIAGGINDTDLIKDLDLERHKIQALDYKINQLKKKAKGFSAKEASDSNSDRNKRNSLITEREELWNSMSDEKKRRLYGIEQMKNFSPSRYMGDDEMKSRTAEAKSLLEKKPDDDIDQAA